jgi:hypothetical protein
MRKLLSLHKTVVMKLASWQVNLFGSVLVILLSIIGFFAAKGVGIVEQIQKDLNTTNVTIQELKGNYEFLEYRVDNVEDKIKTLEK